MGAMFHEKCMFSMNLINCDVGIYEDGDYSKGNKSIHGGGLTLDHNSTAYIEGCRIEGNSCTRTSGGVHIIYGSQAKFIRTSISHNRLDNHDVYYRGAGLRIYDGNTVDFINCEINYNTGATYGGGMVIASTKNNVRLSETDIIGNSADYETGGATRGGAIYIEGDSELTMENCDITGNEATSGHGGAFYIESAPTGSMKGCTIAGNTAGRSGGGIRIYEATDGFKIEHCVFSGNKANSTEAPEYGGGAFSVVEGEPSISNCLIIANEVTTAGNGGAILCQASGSPKLTNCTIADSIGHGVYSDAGEDCLPELLNCIVWDNSLADLVNVDCSQVTYSDIEDVDCGDTNIQADPWFETGSADYGDYCLRQPPDQGTTSPCVDTGEGDASDYGLHTRTTSTDGKYDDNDTDMGYHYVSEKNYYYVNASTGDNSAYDGRSPTVSGGSGPWKTITYALNNIGISNEYNPHTIFVAAGDYDVDMDGGDHEEFPLSPHTQYISLIGDGCDNTKINAYEDGVDHSAIVVEKESELQIDHFTIKGLKITGADNTPPGLGNGGAIRVVESDYLIVDACDIYDNLAKCGGGIYFRASVGNEFRSCIIRDNTAAAGGDGYGGGFCLAGGSDLSTEFSSITDNTASMGGGGVALRNNSAEDDPCSATINGSTIMGNEAVNGGGVYAYQNSHPTVFNTSVKGNKAPGGDGGGVYCENNCDLVLTHANVTNNEARDHGGAVACLDHCCPSINLSSITWNKAGESGAACYLSDYCCPLDERGEEPDFQNSVLAKNEVTGGEGHGAAVYCEISSSPWIGFCTIADNVPSGVFASFDSYPRLDHCILWNNGDDVEGIGCGEDHIYFCDIEDKDCDGQNGNMAEDPLFVPRDPDDDTVWTGYYLAQYGAQNCESPCVDAGAATSEAYGMHMWTTCTDGRRDEESTVDMGCHFPAGYAGTDDTYIELVSFEAKSRGRNILVTWETGTEIDNAGFNLYRVEAGDRTTPEKINDRLIPAKGSPAAGACYEFVDADVRPGITYSYYLVDIETSGKTTRHGPVSARVSIRPIVVPDERPRPRVNRPEILRVMSYMPRFWPVL